MSLDMCMPRFTYYQPAISKLYDSVDSGYPAVTVYCRRQRLDGAQVSGTSAMNNGTCGTVITSSTGCSSSAQYDSMSSYSSNTK